MNFNRIINEAESANPQTAPENYIRRKINQFKSGMITTVIMISLTVLIIASVALYIGFLVVKNL
ncbi:MAG: hypothetical protein EHM58_12390 [Ignavibacteriae bacterium]|nr:MAG: hypothetical protein EHM58_12390 [Ignavibacteriota bacterium]